MHNSDIGSYGYRGTLLARRATSDCFSHCDSDKLGNASVTFYKRGKNNLAVAILVEAYP